MDAALDFIGGVDLVGELVDPPDWDEVATEEPEEPWETVVAVDCALCLRPGDDTGTGLCRLCLDRLPRVGGCGLALALVAALGGGGDPEPPLAHLVDCDDCRAFLDSVAELVRAAHMEVLMLHS